VPTLRRLTIACAIGYPLALVLVVAASRLIGERWWVTAAALYLPAIGFGLPLPFVAAAAWLWAPRRYVALQAVSLVILIFPVMGLSVGPDRWRAREADPVLRVLSLNVGFAADAVTAVARQATATGADVVLLQDASHGVQGRLAVLLQGWSLRTDGEFVIATRHRIRDVYVPPPLVYENGSGGTPGAGGTGGAHYVHYTLDTPIGPLDVINVHPTTPRPAIEEIRGNGLRGEILSGRLFSGKAGGAMDWNAFRRNRQVAGIAARASACAHPVVIAGDTNLPHASRMLREHLGRFDDAFVRAGVGFGYTFPANRPWMRIDRILVNRKLVALKAWVWEAAATDHRGIAATLARRAD
jgi:vancomycin resistance protein VanJ